MIRTFNLICCVWLVSLSITNAQDDIDISKLSWDVFAVQGAQKIEAISRLVSTNDKSLIPTFVLALRWTGNNVYVAEALTKLTGEPISHWHQAYEWQEKHPEVIPHESFRDVKLRLLGNTDKKFLDFFELPYGVHDRMKIRLEEVSWGGVLFDVGIPSLDTPDMVRAVAADYLLEDDLVFGVEINGDIRAYPLRIMGWHEMLNDVIGGVPIVLAYCTLCGSGIVFEAKIPDQKTPFVFGTSGLLYRSNKLMFDRQTNGLWNQFTGEPVVGPLVDSGIKLKIRPVAITTWNEWKMAHPDTLVLSLDTGFVRNYESEHTYQAYFASPDLMFPAVVGDETHVQRKDYVFGIRQVGGAKAWPLEIFHDAGVINDSVGLADVVLMGDPETRTVRAYQRNAGETFRLFSNKLESSAGIWRITEEFLVLENGSQKRARIPGQISYWFAWNNFVGVKSELYRAKQ